MCAMRVFKRFGNVKDTLNDCAQNVSQEQQHDSFWGRTGEILEEWQGEVERELTHVFNNWSDTQREGHKPGSVVARMGGDCDVVRGALAVV